MMVQRHAQTCPVDNAEEHVQRDRAAVPIPRQLILRAFRVVERIAAIISRTTPVRQSTPPSIDYFTIDYFISA
jgi:hypothetical protein